jgi:hypothetical protein
MLISKAISIIRSKTRLNSFPYGFMPCRFPQVLPSWNISLPELRASTAWEPSNLEIVTKKKFLPTLNVMSLTSTHFLFCLSLSILNMFSLQASRREAQHDVLTITTWSWACLEKPPVVHLLKNFPTFYGTPRFITMFISPYPGSDRSSPYHSILSL